MVVGPLHGYIEELISRFHFWLLAYLSISGSPKKLLVCPGSSHSGRSDPRSLGRQDSAFAAGLNSVILLLIQLN